MHGSAATSSIASAMHIVAGHISCASGFMSAVAIASAYGLLITTEPTTSGGSMNMVIESGTGATASQFRYAYRFILSY
eukprot:2232162-Pyramimonas_sp.AAC.1